MVNVLITIGSDGRVTADNNHKLVDQGERVIWNFQGNTAGRELQVVFHTFEPKGGGSSDPINPLGVLVSLGPNQIGGTIFSNAPNGVYIYAIFDGPTQLSWTNPIPRGNFGGLEIPRT